VHDFAENVRALRMCVESMVSSGDDEATEEKVEKVEKV
jgi:hypothetical protein